MISDTTETDVSIIFRAKNWTRMMFKSSRIIAYKLIFYALNFVHQRTLYVYSNLHRVKTRFNGLLYIAALKKHLKFICMLFYF